MQVKVSLLLSVVVGLVVGLSAQERKYLPGEVEGGSRLYSANCTGCHGPEGDGVSGVNFSKGQVRRTSSDEEMVRVIVRGIAGTPMPPFNFSESQAATIVAYIRSMAGSTSAAASCGGAGCAAETTRGRALFEGKGQCATCHMVGPSGGRVGPALTEIGAFRRAVDLERSMVDPQAEIRPENRSVRIVPREGAPITGRLLNQDSFSLQLVDSNEHLVSIDKANVREFSILRTSPMPSYRDKLSAAEIADLVSYLTSLKGK